MGRREFIALPVASAVHPVPRKVPRKVLLVPRKVLLVQRDTPSGVRSAMAWSAGEEVYVCGWGSPLTGLGFDLIEVDGEPRDERERDWFNYVLSVRLFPGGGIRTW